MRMTSAWAPRCSMSLSLQAPVDERAARAERGWSCKMIAGEQISGHLVHTGDNGLQAWKSDDPSPTRSCGPL